jgi:hypothetical protein
MILLELIIFAVGFLWYWFRTEVEVDGSRVDVPRLHAGERLDPR